MIPQSVCFDETASPMPQGDFEWYVVGPRTTVEQAAAITAAGSKLIVKVQPVRWFVDGKPYMDAKWDRILSTLPYLDTPTLDIPGDGMEGSKLLDFRASITWNLTQALTALAAQLGAKGVLFDYGCRLVANGLPDGWAEGYDKYRMRVAISGLQVWNACNHQQATGACMFEDIRSPEDGGSDYSWPPNYMQIRNAGGRSMYLIQNADVKHRRIICGIALENGALVNYRPTFGVDRWHNEVAPELVL